MMRGKDCFFLAVDKTDVNNHAFLASPEDFDKYGIVEKDTLGIRCY